MLIGISLHGLRPRPIFAEAAHQDDAPRADGQGGRTDSARARFGRQQIEHDIDRTPPAACCIRRRSSSSPPPSARSGHARPGVARGRPAPARCDRATMSRRTHRHTHRHAATRRLRRSSSFTSKVFLTSSWLGRANFGERASEWSVQEKPAPFPWSVRCRRSARFVPHHAHLVRQRPPARQQG